MEKFKNKYRIPSARLQTWDYGSNGMYFITICTHNREHFFGKIVDGQMQLNESGKLAEKYWLEIPKHFSFIELGEFVIMPNHIHGILIINKPDAMPAMEMNTTNATNDAVDGAVGVETRLIASLQSDPKQSDPQPPNPKQSTKSIGGFAGNKNPMFHENISRVIRWYKGRCSFEIKKIHAGFAWQTRFHDHIIRNESEYHRISNYIIYNPSNWKDDKFYS